jgi:hypothetical protein
MEGPLTPPALELNISITGISGKTPRKTAMAHEPNTVEQAVTRAVRENLDRLQRMADELHQAINDVVAACASSRPTNALPPMLRAQTTAAALTSSLEVLSRFIAAALQPNQRSPFELEMIRLAGGPASPPAAEPPVETRGPAPSLPTPMAATPAQGVTEPGPVPEAPASEAATTPAEEGFDLNQLSAEEQELHRRANRVAKVSMQDIKMLRPEQVRLGRENRDICIRLRDDIEKAHREYDRRFRPIMAHPVDYFYHWMVQILAEGDPRVLGEYPYASRSQYS